MNRTPRRRLPIGAEVTPGQGVHFRVWAPNCQSVELVLGDAKSETVPLTAEGNGYFSALAPQARAGMRYGFRLDGRKQECPDLASRYQPGGAAGRSQIIDPGQFEWTDSAWPGVSIQGQVLYEMHIGAFTPEGTWRAAAAMLPELADLGITLLELMPITEFPGSFGWSYDGVDLFAPTHWYGTPDDFRYFVDRAHAAGLGVILDVVYNHIGISSNCFRQFATDYFTDRYKNEWGDPPNFDGPHSGPVREFFLCNVEYWIREFHLDGFRIDATQAFFDESPKHILDELTQRARQAAGDRPIVVIAESEPQDTRLLRPVSQGGFGMDAAWNDDFHHTAVVRLTGQTEAYYTDYRGSSDEFLSCAKWGYLFQGQRYAWQKKPRGTPAWDLPAASFINYLQSHDQLANSARGERVHLLTSPGRWRAMTAVLLLLPGTPALFQGQEYCAPQPFLYFNDSDPALAEKIAQGRKRFLSQFSSLALPEVQQSIPEPSDPQTFTRCKLDPAERRQHTAVLDLHRDLLRLRRDDPVFAAQDAQRIHGHVLSADAFALRYFGASGDDRLLIVNFGQELHLAVAPFPLLAPPWNAKWSLLWSSEEPRYGGTGTPAIDSDDNWQLPAEAALVMRSSG